MSAEHVETNGIPHGAPPSGSLTPPARLECSLPGCSSYEPHMHFPAEEYVRVGPPPRMRAQGRRTPANEDRPRPFMLVRYTDVSGVSGEGVVAYGVQWRSGKVSLEWCVPGLPSSVATWDCIADVLVIHGHGNNTVVKWLDEQVELRNAAGEVCIRE